jgi:hypothetical protein
MASFTAAPHGRVTGSRNLVNLGCEPRIERASAPGARWIGATQCARDQFQLETTTSASRAAWPRPVGRRISLRERRHRPSVFRPRRGVRGPVYSGGRQECRGIGVPSCNTTRQRLSGSLPGRECDRPARHLTPQVCDPSTRGVQKTWQTKLSLTSTTTRAFKSSKLATRNSCEMGALPPQGWIAPASQMHGGNRHLVLSVSYYTNEDAMRSHQARLTLPQQLDLAMAF